MIDELSVARRLQRIVAEQCSDKMITYSSEVFSVVPVKCQIPYESDAKNTQTKDGWRFQIDLSDEAKARGLTPVLATRKNQVIQEIAEGLINKEINAKGDYHSLT